MKTRFIIFKLIGSCITLFFIARSVSAFTHRTRCSDLDPSDAPRFNCSQPGLIFCSEGWKGKDCDTPICRRGCHPGHGFCNEPGQCQCQPGWRGDTCQLCMPLSGCRHGYCRRNSYECLCEPGWKGTYCSIPVCKRGCRPSRGYCTKPQECKCRIGWTGITCEQCETLPGCANGYCSKPLECKCKDGWTGHYCNKPKCRSNCNTDHGSCDKPNECRCSLGWWGENCDACFPYPGCKHGTCSKPWECKCNPGWKGLKCDQEDKTTRIYCDLHPETCLNGGTCFDVPDERNYTCSCLSLFTGRHCDYLVESSGPFFPLFRKGVHTWRALSSLNDKDFILPKERHIEEYITDKFEEDTTTTTQRSPPPPPTTTKKTTTPTTPRTTRTTRTTTTTTTTKTTTTTTPITTKHRATTPSTTSTTVRTTSEHSSEVKFRERKKLMSKKLIEKGQSSYLENRDGQTDQGSFFSVAKTEDEDQEPPLPEKKQGEGRTPEHTKEEPVKSPYRGPFRIQEAGRPFRFPSPELSFEAILGAARGNSRTYNVSKTSIKIRPVSHVDYKDKVKDKNIRPFKIALQDTDANSPQANQIDERARFLRHQESVGIPPLSNLPEALPSPSFFKSVRVGNFEPILRVAELKRDFFSVEHPSSVTINSLPLKTNDAAEGKVPTLSQTRIDRRTGFISNKELDEDKITRNVFKISRAEEDKSDSVLRASTSIPSFSFSPQRFAQFGSPSNEEPPKADHPRGPQPPSANPLQRSLGTITRGGTLARVFPSNEDKDGYPSPPTRENDPPPKNSFYEEHYNGRVHIGDVTEVDKAAPLQAIMDAFIELKKLKT